MGGPVDPWTGWPLITVYISRLQGPNTKQKAAASMFVLFLCSGATSGASERSQVCPSCSRGPQLDGLMRDRERGACHTGWRGAAR